MVLKKEWDAFKRPTQQKKLYARKNKQNAQILESLKIRLFFNYFSQLLII